MPKRGGGNPQHGRGPEGPEEGEGAGNEAAKENEGAATAGEGAPEGGENAAAASGAVAAGDEAEAPVIVPGRSVRRRLTRCGRLQERGTYYRK